MRLTAALAIQGLALFLFIPLVLFLFLRQPLGPGWSVAAGLVIMFCHRLVAAPWMARLAGVRCLWCARATALIRLPVVSGGRTWTMSACSEAHATSIRRFLRFADRFRGAIAVGIFVPLAGLLLGSLASAAGVAAVPHVSNALFFRVVVALTVVTASVAYLAARSPSPPDGPPGTGRTPARCPFPLHNLFLLGIGNTLWVFRIVGAWWLIDGVSRLWR